MLAGAAMVMPEIVTLPFAGAAAGLRPGTPDNLPIIGRPTGFEGLVLATGHYRNGILLAPETAEIVTALLAGRTPEVDLSPFRAERLAEEHEECPHVA